jgi:hypothetical protein
MPAIDTRPFLNPPAEVATAEPWMLDLSGVPELLPQELKEWDPGQDIVLKRLINVDVARLCKGAGLSSDADVSLSVSWRSPGSGQRGCAVRRKLERNGGIVAIGLDARFPGYELAGSLRIFTRIVVSRLGSSDDPLAARRVGSILWEDEAAVLLEGLGSRFPMELVDFVQIGFPARAAWRLIWQRDRLHAQAMGCLCLLINRRHSRVAAAATKPAPDPESRAIWSAVQLGVARELIVGALTDEAFVENPSQFEPGSVGDVARTLLERAFAKESPKAIAERIQSKPDLFECQLQAAFNLFEPGTLS